MLTRFLGLSMMIFVLLLALFKSIFLSNYGFGLVDEGESLHNARRILQGGVPYRDFFAIFPPLDNYYYASIMKIFGPSIIAPRILSSVIFSGGVVMMYLLAGPVAALLLTFSDISVERLFFMTPIFIAAYLFTKNRHHFLCGLLLGLISWFRADIPGTFFIAMVISGIFFRIEKRKLAFLTIGYTLPVLGLFAWLMHYQVWSPFYQQAITQALLVTKLTDLSIPNIWQILSMGLNLKTAYSLYTGTYFYLLLFSYVVGTVWCIRHKNLTGSIFLISGALCIPYILGRTDIGHMVKGGMFLFIFLGLTSMNWFSRVVGLFLLIASIGQTLFFLKLNSTDTKIGKYRLRINGNYIPNSTLVSAGTLKEAVTFLQSSDPSQPVLVVPYMAGLYYLADRDSPTRYNNVLGGEVVDQEDFIAQVRNKDVSVIIYDPKDKYSDSGFELKTYNPLIHQYIMESYTTIKASPEGWLFMKKI